MTAELNRVGYQRRKETMTTGDHTEKLAEARRQGAVEFAPESARIYLKGVLRGVHHRTPEQAQRIAASIDTTAFIGANEIDYDGIDKFAASIAANGTLI